MQIYFSFLSFLYLFLLFESTKLYYSINFKIQVITFFFKLSKNGYCTIFEYRKHRTKSNLDSILALLVILLILILQIISLSLTMILKKFFKFSIDFIFKLDQ